MKTIRFNGREVTVLARRRKKMAPAVLVPCRGRLLLNCTNGPGCKGHKMKWIFL